MEKRTMRTLHYIIIGAITVCDAGQTAYNYQHPLNFANNPSIFSGTVSQAVFPSPTFPDSYSNGGTFTESFSSGQTFGKPFSNGPGILGSFSNGPSNLGTFNGLSSTGSFSNGPSNLGTFNGLSGTGSLGANYNGNFGGEPIVSKHFYFHSAPDEHNEAIHKHISLGVPRKNYRVVFIKAPATSIGHAKISVVQPPNEDKTVIYVLSKKAEIADIHADIQQAPEEHSKPEVYFIKYRTPEEAVQAQRQIQAQYDAIGGTSQISDEVIAPITSVIGSGSEGHHIKISGHESDGHLKISGHESDGHIKIIGHDTLKSITSGSGYLPPSKK